MSRIRNYNLTLNGGVQNLATALSVADDPPLRTITLQADDQNANEIMVGDVNLDSGNDIWGWWIPVPTATVPAAPLFLGEHDTTAIKLSDFYVEGTATQILHIMVEYL